MVAPKQRHWAQWIWLAAGLGVAARVAFIFWGQTDPAVPPPPARSGPRVTVVAGNGAAGGPLMREQIELLDQQPLSMPTRWNAGAQPLPADLRRQPGEVFGVYDARLAFAAERLEPVFGPKGGAPADGRGGLRAIGPMAGGWAGLARLDRPIARLGEREAAIEVRGYSGDADPVVLRVSLSGFPPAVRQHDWAPLEFSVAVERGGLVGVPNLAIGSGVEEVDAFFGGFLARDCHLGERVPPGFYRVIVVQ